MRFQKLMMAVLTGSVSLIAAAQNSYTSPGLVSGSNAATGNGGTSTAAALQGHEGFNCASGSSYQMLNGVASCKMTVSPIATPPSACAATTLSQGSCAFQFPRTTSGSTPSVQSSSTGYSGSGSATCSNGSWNSLSATCVPSPCSSTTSTYGACTYSIPALASGARASVSTSTANYTGSEIASCTNGVLTTSGATCAVQSPCVAGTVNWNDPSSGTGAACKGTVSQTASGSSTYATETYPMTQPYGSATFACSNGTWSALSTGFLCAARSICAAFNSQTYNYFRDSLHYGPGTSWGKGCGASPSFGAQNSNTNLHALPIQQVAQNANAGYQGAAAYSCADWSINGSSMAIWYGPQSPEMASDGFGTGSLAQSCGDSTPTCSKPYIAFTTDVCTDVTTGGSSYAGAGFYGSIVYPVTSACDSTTSEAWATSTPTYPVGAQWGCSKTVSYITNFLGMPQVAEPNGAKGSTSKFSYTYASSISAPTMSLVLNSSGGWSVTTTGLNGAVPPTVGSGTWNTKPTVSYQYQVLAAQDLAGNGGLTPTGTAYSMPVQSAWTTISGSMTVLSCKIATGQKTCSGEWVVNVRAVSTTTPVYSNAIILSVTTP